MGTTQEIKAAPSALALLDAPDESIGDSQKEQQIPHALQVLLPQPVVEDMVKCSDLGRPLQLTLGSAPFLRFGDASRSLQLSASAFRREIYKSSTKDVSELHFNGIVSHEAVIAEAKEATKGAESALATLQASLAQYQKDKEDNSATFIRSQTTKTMQPNKRGNNNKINNKRPWGQPALFHNVPRSLPSSPSLRPQSKPTSISNSHLQSQSQSLAPTSIPTQSNSQSAAKTQAQRFALFHYLALGPASEASITKATGIPKDDLTTLLEKFAEPSTTNQHLWELRDRWFKELKVWSFNYPTSENRQAAINNAVRAFDRQRVSKEDKLWQLLLPKEERGKGKSLSKLNIEPGKSLANRNPASREEQHDSAKTTKQLPPPAGDDEATATPAPTRSNQQDQLQQTTTQTSKSSPNHHTTSSQSDSQSPMKRKTPSYIEKRTDFGDPDEGSDDLAAVLSSVNHSEVEGRTKATKPAPPAKNRSNARTSTTARSKPKANAKVKSDEFVHDSDDIGDGLESDSRPKKKAKTDNADAKPATKTQSGSTAASKPAPKPSNKPQPSAINSAIPTGDGPKVYKVSKTAPPKANENGPKTGAGSSQNASAKTTSEKQNADAKTTSAQPKVQAGSEAKPAAPPKAKTDQTSKNKTQTQTETQTSSSSQAQAQKPTKSSHRPTSSLPTNALKPTSPLKRPAEDQPETESASKKSRSNGPTNGPRERSQSSPLTNTSDLPTVSTPSDMKKSPIVSSKTPSKPNGEGASENVESSQKSSVNDVTVKEGVENGVNGNDQQQQPQQQQEQQSPPAHAETKVMLKELRLEYYERFKKHIAMHLAFDKLPASSDRDQSDYRKNGRELQELTNTIKFLMRRIGQDDTTFSLIPKKFSTAEIPGLMDYITGKLAGLKKSYKEEMNSQEPTTPATKKRLAELTKEMEDLEALRNH